MVPGSQQVNTAEEQLLCGLLSYPEATGGVFPVGDDQIQVKLALQSPQIRFNRAAPRASNHISDH
jgi:hypothetical protein